MITVNILVTLNILIIVSVLLFRKNNALPNKILAAIFLIPGLNFVNNINILTGSIYNLPYAYFIVQGTAVLFAPLVYYYILLLTGKKITSQKIFFIISCMLLFFDIYMGIDFAFKSEAIKVEYIASVAAGPYPEEMELYSLLFFLLQLVYFTLGIKTIDQYRRSVEASVSDMEESKITYLKKFIALFWVLTLATIVLYVCIDTVYVEYIFLPVVICLIYVFVLFCAFHNNVVFTKESFHQYLERDVAINLYRSAKNSEDTKQVFPNGLPDRIRLLVNEKKLFKDPEITIQKLAEELNMPAYLVTKAISQGLGESFYDLINKKRVEEAQLLLTDNAKRSLSIEGIAYEAGFNSRTAFYRAFKKYLGKTPSDLIEK